jgi:rRNA maturation endonuclease Nob1
LADSKILWQLARLELEIAALGEARSCSSEDVEAAQLATELQRIKQSVLVQGIPVLAHAQATMSVSDTGSSVDLGGAWRGAGRRSGLQRCGCGRSWPGSRSSFCGMCGSRLVAMNIGSSAGSA